MKTVAKIHLVCQIGLGKPLWARVFKACCCNSDNCERYCDESAPSSKQSLFEWQNEQKKSAIGELPRLIFAYEDNRPLQGGVLMKYFQIFWSNAISRKWPSTAYAIAVSPISWFWQAATSRQCREILTTRKQTWLPRSMAAYWMQIAVRTRKDLRKNSTKIVAPRRVIEPKSIRLGVAPVW